MFMQYLLASKLGSCTLGMDTRNYEELISGSRSHWQQLDVDGTGSGVGVTRVINVSIILCSSLPCIVHKEYW